MVLQIQKTAEHNSSHIMIFTRGRDAPEMWFRTEPSVGRLSKKERRQLDSSLSAAIEKLVTQTGHGPFILASDVPQSTFDAWDDDSKAAWGIAYDELSQSILMYGDTGGVHAGLSGYIFQSLLAKHCVLSLELAGTSHSSSEQQRSAAFDTVPLKSFGRTTMYTRCRGAKSPDLSFYADGTPSSRSVVFEIAHRNEDFVALQREVQWWHDAGIGLSVGIFVDPHSDISDPNLILLTYSSGHTAMTQKRFGHMSGCNAAKLPHFMLQIPYEHLIDNVSQQEVLNTFIPLDLHKLQQKIIKLLCHSVLTAGNLHRI